MQDYYQENFRIYVHKKNIKNYLIPTHQMVTVYVTMTDHLFIL